MFPTSTTSRTRTQARRSPSKGWHEPKTTFPPSSPPRKASRVWGAGRPTQVVHPRGWAEQGHPRPGRTSAPGHPGLPATSHLSGALHPQPSSGPGRRPPGGLVAAPWWLRRAAGRATGAGVQDLYGPAGPAEAGRTGEGRGVGGAFARLSRRQLQGLPRCHLGNIDSSYLRFIFIEPSVKVTLFKMPQHQ